MGILSKDEISIEKLADFGRKVRLILGHKQGPLKRTYL
jgi:hypothetical protein